MIEVVCKLGDLAAGLGADFLSNFGVVLAVDHGCFEHLLLLLVGPALASLDFAELFVLILSLGLCLPYFLDNRALGLCIIDSRNVRGLVEFLNIVLVVWDLQRCDWAFIMFDEEACETRIVTEVLAVLENLDGL